MSKLKNQYVGRSGHLAVMAEFLIRGYNTAIPEVDRGDDILVVEDAVGQIWRVQVKTGSGKETARSDTTSYTARFKGTVNK